VPGTLEPGSETTVILVKEPRPNVSYRAVVEYDDGTHIVVRAPWSGAPAKDLGVVRFEPGDIFVELYWRDRWYSVKEVSDGDQGLKGWYCDVNRPAQVESGAVFAADLYLDLWMSADGSVILRLDEDEFAASGLEDQDPDAAAHARRALDELERLAHADSFRSLR
jgi:predicted RNA-binding protein associated with RNAse of E/G family